MSRPGAAAAAMAALPGRVRQAIGNRVGRSIGVRIVVVFVGLLFVLQVASFSAIRASLDKHARDTLPERLNVGQRVLGSLLEQRAQKLSEGARLLAADYGFRSAVQSNDAETIASVLDNHGQRIGATETALLGTDFALRASSGADIAELAPLIGRLAVQAAAHGAASGVALLGGRPHQVALVQMRAPTPVGWVLMGLPLDGGLATEMQALSALNLTLLTRTGAGQPWHAALTSLPPALAAGLARQRWAAPGLEPAAGTPSTMQTVSLQDEDFGVRDRWLTSAAAADAGGGRAVLALVSVSIDDAVRLPRDLQLSLLLITLLGFVVFAFGSLLTARRVAAPLHALSAAAERLGAGDHATPIEGRDRHDEIGQLAQSFERMRIKIGEKQAQIMKLAYRDPLTDLPNRLQFRDAVVEAIEQARAEGTPVAVIMLDLDRFKHVNDVLGYRFGDMLLKRVAERLTLEVMRSGDIVARLGGDEFAVLLRHGSETLAAAVAQRIAQAFDAPLKLEEHTVDMGAGIGMACWPQHAADADLLLSRAEIAMVAAKRRTQGPLMYEASIDAASTQTLSLLTELRRAVDHGELRLFLQPKLSLETGNLDGAEALVRWQHPQRGLVPPMEFIPFAEQTGFIRVLTMWVFEEAARHWLALRADGVQLLLSVNLSTRDLLDLELPQKFDALLLRLQVPAEAFCLEITESAIMDDPQRALATLDRLSALGFKLSIDDFGTGYSSLAYLKRLPVDELKIDRSFVMNMATDADDAMIVRSTIDLAHNMGLTVVAEGVETAIGWDLLRELDCDSAQGYHMGKPMPVAEFQAWSLGWTARQRRKFAASAFMLH